MAREGRCSRDIRSRRKPRGYESREPLCSVFHDEARRLWNRLAAESANRRGPWRIVGANESKKRQRGGGFAAPAALSTLRAQSQTWDCAVPHPEAPKIAASLLNNSKPLF